MLSGLIAVSLVTASFAGETITRAVPAPATGYSVPSASLYNAGEWNIDLFGAYAFSSSSNSRLVDDDAFGGGLGFTYFISRNFGIGAEGTLFDTEGDTLGTTALNLVLRFPVAETGLAPYVYGGVGLTFNADDLESDDFRDARDRIDDNDDPRDSDDVVFLGHAGAGVEYRFTPHTSLFTDFRYTWSERDHGDFCQARAGVRFAF